MAETTVPPPVFAPEAPPSRSGLLKWGLIGCAGISVLLIAGLIIFSLKARDLTGALLRQTETIVLTQCAPEVTPEQRETFRAAYERFIGSATAGNVSFDRMAAVRTKLTAAVADGKVTPDELRELTVSAGENATPK